MRGLSELVQGSLGTAPVMLAVVLGCSKALVRLRSVSWVLAVKVETSAMRLPGLVTACPRATARHDSSRSRAAACRVYKGVSLRHPAAQRWPVVVTVLHRRLPGIAQWEGNSIWQPAAQMGMARGDTSCCIAPQSQSRRLPSCRQWSASLCRSDGQTLLQAVIGSVLVPANEYADLMPAMSVTASAPGLSLMPEPFVPSWLCTASSLTCHADRAEQHASFPAFPVH